MIMTNTSRKQSNRKADLVRLLQTNDAMLIDNLAASAGVSSSTLRRDLRDLVTDGVVRINVGQVSLALPSKEYPFVIRSVFNTEEKIRIACAAMDLVQNGDTLFLAGGTTTQEFAKQLPGRRRLTVITNALRVVNALVDKAGIELIVLGGAVRPGEHTLHGHLTEWAVNQFRADKFIYGIEAISLQHGLTHSQLLEVNTDRALADASTQVIVLADHTKFGKVAPVLVLPLEKVNILVTGRELPDSEAEGLRAKNIRVVFA
jgi:DeoR/GlpR family transcriptional regulator of sugar metabolism